MGVPGAVVVVGGGLAGLRALEWLRREGYDGTLTLIGEERELPYDRPPLTKDVLVGTREPSTLTYRGEEQLAELEVDLLLGAGAHALDTERRVVETSAGAVPYEAVILATGAAARQVPLLSEREGVFVVRTLADSLRLGEALAGASHATVVGAGFIGSEVASSARARGVEVTVLELETAPLARVLGLEMGAALTSLHGDNGTEVRLGTTIESVEQNGGIDGIRLTDGSALETDVVVVGIGAVPNVGWLESSGLELANGVLCDAALRAGPPGVYAVGDIASWPNELFGRRMRVEHWMNAADQAAHVAKAIVHGTEAPFLGANYVWSDQYGLKIQFAGIATGDVEVVDGSVAERRFLAWYREGDRLVGAIGIGMPRPVMRSMRRIEARTTWEDARAALAADEL